MTAKTKCNRRKSRANQGTAAHRWYQSRILAVVLCLSLVTGLIPLMNTETVYAKVIAQGECGAEGSNVTWKFDDSGTLTISGTGEMVTWDDLDVNEYPYWKYRDQTTSIVIEDGVTNIPAYAFVGFEEVTSVTISESVTIIESSAFSGCGSLPSVELPKNLEEIRMFAFNGCGLTSITIPESVTCIGDNAFMDCQSLKTFYVESSVPPEISSGVFYQSYPDVKIYVPSAYISDYRDAWSEYVDKIQDPSIGSWACGADGDNCTATLEADGTIVISGTGKMKDYSGDNPEWYDYNSSITGIVIENGITTIGERAFYGCSSLKSVAISDSVTSIGDSAFSNCGLTSVNIPNSVTSIGDSAFSNCGLTSVNIPNSVTSIGDSAFSSCSLTSVTIPESVTSIGSNAFDGCNSLKSVYVYSSILPAIGADAFSNTSNDLRINVPREKVEEYKAADGWKKYADKIQVDSELEWNCGADGENCIATLYISEGYLVISGTGDMKDYSEYNEPEWHDYAALINKIDIEDGVTYIGDNAFINCYNLKSVYVRSTTLLTIGENVFDINSGFYIYVPASKYEEYLDSYDWETYYIGAFTADEAILTLEPSAKTLTYNGTAQELVTAGEADNGTVQYALGENAGTAPATGWTESVPTGIVAGTYYVWYMVKGNDDYEDTAPRCVTVTIIPDYIVTFKVVNGSWDDGTTDDWIVEITGDVGDILKLVPEIIPSVGNKPDENCTAGSWDVTPDADTEITANTTYTYKYEKIVKQISGLGTSSLRYPSDPTGLSVDPWRGDFVYYGKYDGINPTRYRVLYPNIGDFGIANGSLFLDCDSVLYKMPFDSDGIANEEGYNPNDWAVSDVKASLNGTDFLDKDGNFTVAEKAAIAGSTKDSIGYYGGAGRSYLGWAPLSGEKIFLLDATEVTSPWFGYREKAGSSDTRIKKDSQGECSWWLRSPNTSYNDKVGGAEYDSNSYGSTTSEYVNDSSYGVSPAFNISRSSVISSSLIGSFGSGYSEFKLTIKDDDLNIATTSGKKVTIEEDNKTVTVPYTITDNSTTSTPSQVSVVITDGTWTDGGWSNGAKLLQYGMIDEISGTASGNTIIGTGRFKLDDSITGTWGTDYHVYILAEDVKLLSTLTDYASTPFELAKPAEKLIYEVTFKVANGSWDDGTTADKTVILTGYEGDVLKISGLIPSVGKKPNETYKAGSWNVAQIEDEVITADTSYTYTYAKKETISTKVTFKVVNGFWNDGTSADKVVTLTGLEGDELILGWNQIPNVGYEPKLYYKYGDWDSSLFEPITSDTVYTYTYIPQLTSGTFDGCSWTFRYDDNILTISKAADGDGSMNNYDWGGEKPWDGLEDDISVIVIEDGVTEISPYAFMSIQELFIVYIPGSVKSINSYTFYDCSKLRYLFIEDGVTKIESSAFGECNELESVSVGVGEKGIVIEAEAFPDTTSVAFIAEDFGSGMKKLKTSFGELKVDENGIVTLKADWSSDQYALETWESAALSLVEEEISIFVADATYTGSALRPAVVVKDYGKKVTSGPSEGVARPVSGGKQLTEGIDYTVAYSNNINAGTGTVTITGKGLYAGTLTETFKIEKADAPNKPETTINVDYSISKVSGVSLPNGWAWSSSDKDKALTAGTGVTATAEYTGSDKDKYKNTSISITIVRGSCTHASLTHKAAVGATCNSDGNTEYWTCSSCGQYFSDKDGKNVISKNSWIVKAKGHISDTAVKEKEVAATCTAAGSYDEVVYCKTCHAEISRNKKTVNALGHSYGTPAYSWSSDHKTCTATVICGRTGCTDGTTGYKVTETVNSTSRVKKAATATSKGVTEYTAKFTNSLFSTQTKDVEDIPATGENPSPVILGDVNDDGKVDAKDVTVLRRYLAGGWNVTINTDASDLNADKKIDAKDVTILRRYLAGGWGVVLGKAQ